MCCNTVHSATHRQRLVSAGAQQERRGREVAAAPLKRDGAAGPRRSGAEACY